MVLVYIANKGSIDNFVEYLCEEGELYCESSTLMRKFSDENAAKKFAEDMYEAGFDVFTIGCKWHDEEEG